MDQSHQSPWAWMTHGLSGLVSMMSVVKDSCVAMTPEEKDRIKESIAKLSTFLE